MSDNKVSKLACIIMAVIYAIATIAGIVLYVSIFNGNNSVNMHEVHIATIAWLVLMPLMFCIVARSPSYRHYVGRE